MGPRGDDVEGVAVLAGHPNSNAGNGNRSNRGSWTGEKRAALALAESLGPRKFGVEIVNPLRY